MQYAYYHICVSLIYFYPFLLKSISFGLDWLLQSSFIIVQLYTWVEHPQVLWIYFGCGWVGLDGCKTSQNNCYASPHTHPCYPLLPSTFRQWPNAHSNWKRKLQRYDYVVRNTEKNHGKIFKRKKCTKKPKRSKGVFASNLISSFWEYGL